MSCCGVAVYIAVGFFILSSALSEKCNDDGAAKYSKEKNMKEHYNIVLIGATGDLAKKYVWHALFTVFKHRCNDLVHFRIYAAARSDVDTGRRKISKQLLGLVNCESDAKCFEMKRKFVESVQYHRLKTERDFVKLSDLLYENTQSMYGIEPGSAVTYESGRLIYMAIPPSAYAVTAKYVHTYLRPKIGRPWMRIILEKPFGQDLDSAKTLAKDIAVYFNETEIYRIDHFLGKATVSQMLPFRYINRKIFEPLWNRDHIRQVDIVIKERDSVAGRTSFYDEVGVVADVMQNHMTEMLALIAMELPEDSGNIKSLWFNKVRLLRDVRQPDHNSILTGQYTTYNSELFRERENKSKSFNMSTTPTFAAVVLYVDNWRWHGVPFLLVSGKKLDEKASYVRIHFRNSQFCASAAFLSDNRPSCSRNNQIVFHLSDSLSYSRIAVSRGLPKPEPPRPGWSTFTDSVKTNQESMMFDQKTADMVQFVADQESEPYVELINAAFDGARHHFVPVDSLMAAWNIWTAVIDKATCVVPRQYLGLGKDSSRLDFFITRDGMLRYWVDEHNVENHSIDQFSSTVYKMPKLAQIPTTFRNATLITGSEAGVAAKLTEFIVAQAHEKVARGLQFHLAVSGGRTPEKLFQMLSRSSIPWRHTHVWMVDERCDGSNFEIIGHNLLLEISTLPLMNIHPMLPNFGDEPCSEESPYRHDKMYENAIRHLVVNASFDFIVLGVGEDGHTASLFPGEMTEREHEQLVTFARAHNVRSDLAASDMRLTLTLRAINSAHNVVILVTGAEKYSILETVRELNNSAVNEYPVVGVEPASGSVTWYVDYNALFGPAVL